MTTFSFSGRSSIPTTIQALLSGPGLRWRRNDTSRSIASSIAHIAASVAALDPSMPTTTICGFVVFVIVVPILRPQDLRPPFRLMKTLYAGEVLPPVALDLRKRDFSPSAVEPD